MKLRMTGMGEATLRLERDSRDEESWAVVTSTNNERDVCGRANSGAPTLVDVDHDDLASQPLANKTRPEIQCFRLLLFWLHQVCGGLCTRLKLSGPSSCNGQQSQSTEVQTQSFPRSSLAGAIFVSFSPCSDTPKSLTPEILNPPAMPSTSTKPRRRNIWAHRAA